MMINDFRFGKEEVNELLSNWVNEEGGATLSGCPNETQPRREEQELEKGIGRKSEWVNE